MVFMCERLYNILHNHVKENEWGKYVAPDGAVSHRNRHGRLGDPSLGKQEVVEGKYRCQF